MIFVYLWLWGPDFLGPNFRTNIFQGPVCRKKSLWAWFANVEEEDDDVDDEDKGQSVEQKVWLIDDECPSHLHVLISISKWNSIIKLHRKCFLAVKIVSPQIKNQMQFKKNLFCILKVRVVLPHKSPFVCLYMIWAELFLSHWETMFRFYHFCKCKPVVG